jgi:hypothetical protein
MTVVVISETANSTDVVGTFRDALSPVVCLEGLIWDDMEMAPQALTTSQDTVEILAVGSPLAGGLVGTLTVMQGGGSGLFHTSPGPNAEVVASRPGTPSQVVYFAFEAGVPMENAFAAPARRVGLGFDADQGVVQLASPTDDGLTLFEAAVLWATE